MGWAIVWKGLADKSNLRGIVKIVFSGRYILIIPNPCVGLCKNRIPLFVYRIMRYGGGSPILKNHHISFVSAANWGSHCWTNPKPKHVFGRSMTGIPSTSTWNSVGGSALSTNQWEKGIFVAVTCKTFKFSPKGLTKWRQVSMARLSFCWTKTGTTNKREDLFPQIIENRLKWLQTNQSVAFIYAPSTVCYVFRTANKSQPNRPRVQEKARCSDKSEINLKLGQFRSSFLLPYFRYENKVRISGTLW